MAENRNSYGYLNKILKFIQRNDSNLSDETKDKINLSLKTYFKKRRFKPTDIKKYISLLDRQIVIEKQYSKLKNKQRELIESLKAKLDDDTKQKIEADYQPRKTIARHEVQHDKLKKLLARKRKSRHLYYLYGDYFEIHSLEYKQFANIRDDKSKQLSNLKTMRRNLTETMLKGIF